MSKSLHNAGSAFRHATFAGKSKGQHTRWTGLVGALRSFIGFPECAGFALGDSLHNLLNRADFKLVDIGARGGAMSQLRLLAPFSRYYACEPDTEAARMLAPKMRKDVPWRDITVIPEAISSTEGEASLHVTKQPGLSSLLVPDYAVVRRYYSGDEFRIVSTTPVRTLSLDHAADRYNFRDACFLKLDTQGTELDILQSGKTLLQEALLAVHVEVEFHSFYMGQALFSDVDSYLRGLGFTLFDMHRALLRRASYRDDFYSRRQVVWAHALYAKEPDTLLQVNDALALLRVCRLLGLALAFEHYDLALELLNSERSAALLFQSFGSQVRANVEELVRHRTKAILSMTKSRQSATAFAYKDRKHIYG